MGDFLTITLAVVCLILLGYLIRLKVILNDLADAISKKSTYLQDARSKIIPFFHINRLVHVYADLLLQERKMKALEYEMQNQIDALLGKIQEAVYTIDQNNKIIHSNQAACDKFNQGNPIKGKRIEELIRNPEFLDCAHLAKNGKPQSNREISITVQGKVFWFEVSGTPIPKSSVNPYGSVLFVFHDITRLKELEIVKNNFVANVSHELKTPITVIKGFTETLIDDNDELNPETRLKFLNKIENNAERLNLIVQDLLTLSRIESDPEFLNRKPTTFAPALDAIVENFRSLIKPTQHLNLVNHHPALVLNMDEFKINQVIQNLLDNAIRYSGDETAIQIELKLSENGEQAICAISDNGRGIPEADLPNIFRRFYRVDKARSRLNGGTGLGLSIARRIVELHGGTIEARNLPEGGLCVAFTLPVS